MTPVELSTTRPVAGIIGRQLFRQVLLVTLLLAGLFTWLQVWLDARAQLRGIDERVEQIRKAQAEPIANSLWSFNREQSLLLARSLLHIPNLVYVRIEPSDGDAITAGTHQDHDTVEAVIPLMHHVQGRNDKLGVLRLQADTSGILDAALAKAAVAAGFQVLTIVIIAGVLLLLFDRQVTRHLAAANHYFRTFDPADLSVPLQLAKANRGDELDVLAATFNRMRESLAQAHHRQADAMAQLGRSEASQRDLLRDLPVAIVVHASDGSIAYRNPLAESLLGPATGNWPLVHDDGRALASEDQPLAQVRRSGEPLRELVLGIDAPAGRVWVLINAFPEFSAPGILNRVVVTLVDISARRAAEQAIVVLNERLSLATRAAGIGIWDWDVVHNTLVWDDEMYRIFGVRREDFTSDYEAWLRTVIPDDAALASRAIEAALAGTREFSVDFRIHWHDGSTRFIRANGQVFRDADGRALRMVGVNYDVTDRRQAEEALRASEQRFREALDFLPLPIGIASADGTILHSNRCFTDTFGYTPAEMTTVARWMEMAYPEPSYREHVLAVWGEDIRQATLAGASSPIREYQVRCKDGSTKLVNIWGHSVGAILVAVFEDNTEHKRLDEELQRHRQHLEELVALRSIDVERARRLADQYFTVASALTLTLDLEGRITRINPAGCHLLGWSSEELVGRNWFTTCLPPDECDTVLAYFYRLVGDNAAGHDAFQRERYENAVITKAGERRVLMFHNAFLRDEHGGIIGVLSSAIDITDHKQAESDLRQAKEAADAANRAKSDFLASMSHEIRTPLNAVLGYAQMLVRDASLAVAHRKAVEVINRSGEHLLTLINDILEMSRIEAGHTTSDPEDFDLHGLLDNLQSLFMQRACDKGLRLTVQTEPDLPQYMRTDQRKLRQILLNLLSNAIKFTTSGEITLLAGAQSDRLTIAIQDTGCGIAQSDQQHLFSPFVQAQAGRHRGDGSGLGLALSRGFAQVMGGTLTFVSTLGHGSTFTLAVPVTVVTWAVRQQTRSQVVGLAPGQRPPFLLIAEDHSESRQLLSHILTNAGCQVQAVNDGAAAVAACKDQRPDLVWMDIDMPVMDGLTAAQAIRALPGSPPYIVAFTAAAFETDRQRILAGGCDEIVHKPYREDELFATMERLLDLRFIWKEGVPSGQRLSPTSHAELRAGLAALPLPERERLREAVITGDLDAIGEQTKAWNDRSVAAGVAALAQELAVDRLLSLLDDL